MLNIVVCKNKFKKHIKIIITVFMTKYILKL